MVEYYQLLSKRETAPIFEVLFDGKTQWVGITISDNGFIVGANPTSIN